MNKNRLLLLTFVLAFIGLYIIYEHNKPATYTLTITPTVGTQPLVFNDSRYPNPGGTGTFSIRAFQFYISNIKLVSDDATYIEPESYHLVRFDNTSKTYTITLKEIPNLAYQAIELSIGVDPKANGTITVSGDVNPNSRMAWSWDVGYKFVLFEGTLDQSEKRTPLVYHIGFDENYASLSFPLQSDTKDLRANVDIMRMFHGPSTIDMSQLPTIKFDRKDSQLMSRNYRHMLKLN